MDDDEIRMFAEGRPAAPPYRAEARAQARKLLLAEAGLRRNGGRFRLPRFGWQAAAAFGTTVALVGGVTMTLSNQGAGGPATSLTQSAAVADELNPQPGQYIMIESDTMYPSFSIGKKGEESRHLYRTHRKIWQSVDARKDGLLMIENREPQPWPGRELPEFATKEPSSWSVLPVCPNFPQFRTDYAYLSTLPADPAAMRDHVYQASSGQVSEGKNVDKDAAAFIYVMDLVREKYVPEAQRDALFEAAKSIPGVQAVEGVADSAGRKGVALGRMNPQGTLTQAIFDPATHMFLGERQTVVEDKGVGAPAGSTLALTAQLNVSVVDELPKAPLTEGAVVCDRIQPEATPAPTGTPTPDESFPTPAITRTVTPRPTPTITRTVTPRPAENRPTESLSVEDPVETPPADE
ncbi:CU044_5270 family protein [Nonomuraea sp. H19]|uniref:CU044_5270 family protein n=1 Tax=Nonomuraea sp. H19 TaxID=3452206 RepID=UPI003F890EDC